MKEKRNFMKRKYSMHGMQFTMHRASSFLRKNVVMVVALLAAIVTSVIVPPDREYLG